MAKKNLYKVIERALNRGRDVEVFVEWVSPYYGSTIRTRLISNKVCRYTDEFSPSRTLSEDHEMYKSCFYSEGMTVRELVRNMRKYDRDSLGGEILHVNVLK